MRDVQRQFDGILRRCSNRVLPAVQSSRRSAGSGSSVGLKNDMHHPRVMIVGLGISHTDWRMRKGETYPRSMVPIKL